MIVALGQIKSGDHQGSWSFITSWPIQSPADLRPSDIYLLDQSCDEFEVVKLWQGEESYQWWPTTALAERTGTEDK